MNKTRGIVWFRNDLRLHDNEALTEALAACDEILPIYIFDERLYRGKMVFGFDKISAKRVSFIIESVKELRQNLIQRESQLLVMHGKTEDVIREYAQSLKTKWVFCNRERTQEEVGIQDAVEQQLWAIGQEMRYSRGKMLLYTADLPFPVTHTPDRFTTFKKEVAHVPIRQPLPIPEVINTIPLDGGFGAIPTLQDLGKKDAPANPFVGGENNGLNQLAVFMESLAQQRKDDRPIMSPWLAQGCLSPKRIYHGIKSVETRHNKALIDNYLLCLIRRDHMRFMGKKFGDLIFQRKGMQDDTPVTTQRDADVINAWCTGNTGYPLIDAAMRALVHTGHLSYRLRVLVSSYFIHDLKQDWLVGASFFESHLLDYDPCSNYGNWNRLAGVGAVKRDEVHFNMENQMKSLDPDGTFVNEWLDTEELKR